MAFWALNCRWRGLGAPQRMRAVSTRVQADRRHPVRDKRVLPGRYMRPIKNPAGKQKHTPEHFRRRSPVPDGLTRVFRGLEPYRSLCLALDDRDTIAGAFPDNEVGDL